jgi:hypothetical protein
MRQIVRFSAQKSSKTEPVSLRFASERKIAYEKPAHPN